MAALLLFGLLIFVSNFTSHGKFNKKAGSKRGLVGPLVIVAGVLFLLAHVR